MTSDEYGQYIDDFELDVDVMPGESLTEYIERRRREFESKADGGSIGIEVLFEEKKPRKDFNTGGTTYDSRASAVDYATALDKVGAGTAAQKRQSLSDYLGNVISTQGQKLGTAAVIPLQAAKGVLGIQGTPITDSMQASLQQIIQDKISKTGKLKGGIDYRDYGVQTTTGKEFEGFGKRSITDPEAALATTLGQADYVVDPITGKVTFTGGTAYDFRDDQFGGLGKFISKGGVFSDQATQYNPDITLSPNFIKQTRTPLSESDFFKQFYGVPYKGFENKFFKTLQKGDPNYDEVRRSSSAGSFSDLVDRGIIQAYTGPTDYKNYLSTFADGGRVGLFMGGPALEGQALQIYNSMKGYNFSDQQIADALQGQGLYTPAGGGGGGEGGNEQFTGIIGTQLNRGDDSVTSIAPGTLQKQYQAQLNNPINNFLYETGAKIKASQPYQKSMNLGAMAIGALSGIPGLGFLLDKLGQPGFNRGNIREMNTPKTLDATKFSDTSGINTDFGGVTVDDLGRIVQTGDYLTGENVMAGYNTGFDLTGTAFDRIDKITSRGPLSDYNRRKVKALKDFAAASAKSRKDALQAEIERAQRIKDEAARAAATQAARVKSISEGYGGHDDSPGATGPTAAGAGMGVGGGYASDYGFLKDGGLATMFTRRR